MINMRKYLVYILIISFVLFPMSFIQAEEVRISLRSNYRDLSVPQVQLISNISIRKNHNYGFFGYSTVTHRYEDKSINGDSVVINHATGLMWHQSGSDKGMGWNEAKQWVKNLNRRGYAGYFDWRLPTVEEAASLLELSRIAGDLFIAAVFDVKQSGIWTGDKNDSASYLEGVWSVRFKGAYGAGDVSWCYENASNYVRPVRSMK
jgi:serine/threonine-protein kinase